MLKHQLKVLKRLENVPRPSSNATWLSYLASLAPEERERHLVDFHVTYARAIQPPAKKKTPLKSKKVPHASNTNNLDQRDSLTMKEQFFVVSH